MKHSARLLVVAVVYTVILSAVSAEKAEEWRGWLDEAWQTNPALIRARQQWHAAKARTIMSRSLEDPMLGIEIMRKDSLRIEDADERKLMLSQRLPWFGTRQSRLHEAERTAEAAALRLLELQRDIRTDVKTAHAYLHAAEQAAEIQRETVALLKRFEAIAIARYEAGEGLRADVLRAQVRLDTLQTDLVTREREIEVARARINRLLGAPQDTFRSSGAAPHIQRPEQSLEKILEQGRRYRFAIFAADREIEAREAALRQARLQNAPTIELRVAARQMDGRSGIQGVDTGVAINLPWLWHNTRSAEIAEAEATLEAARAAYRDTREQTDLDIKERYVAADTGWRTLQLYENTIFPRTRELVETTRAAFEAGQVSLLELIEAQKSWEDARLAYENARARYVEDTARLESWTYPWTRQEIESGLIPESGEAERQHEH